MRRTSIRFDSDRLPSPGKARRPLRRMWSRGRERAVSLAETIVEDAPHLVDELRRDAAPYVSTLVERAAPIVDRAAPLVERAAPMVERAMGRAKPRHRKRNASVVFLGLAAIAGLLYWLWQRRDQHPAYLMDEPDQPNVTPASGSPMPGTPAPAPGPWGGNSYDREPQPHAEDRPATALAEQAGDGTMATAGETRDSYAPRPTTAPVNGVNGTNGAQTTSRPSQSSLHEGMYYPSPAAPSETRARAPWAAMKDMLPGGQSPTMH